MFTIAVAVNNMQVLRNNLCLSPGLSNGGRNQLVIKQDYPSAASAYNSAIDEAENEIIIFAHQDIYLPETWFQNLIKCLSYLEDKQFNWGVLGCFGSGKNAGAGQGMVYTTGLGFHGKIIARPEPVETLDEIILAIRKSSGLRFDPGLTNFHLYGADLCMAARDKGMTNFAFQGFCVHNTNQLLSLPKEFYDSYFYVKNKWAKFLPIYTSCLTISRFDKELRLKRLNELIGKIQKRKRAPLLRLDDPRAVLGKSLQSEEFGKLSSLGG